MMATLDVLERAAASHKNLIITHEPTFYNHLDTTDNLKAQNDPVLAAKQEFIAKHDLVIWRFHLQELDLEAANSTIAASTAEPIA